MDLTPHVAALRDDLAAAAAVGDEATSRAGSTLAAALEPAMRLALMNALSELATEIDGALDDRSVSLRLRGREVDVVVSGADHGGEPAHAGGFFAGPSSSPFAGPGGRFDRPGPPPGPGGPHGGPQGGSPWDHGGPDVGDISRMTLRIVDQIKGQAERAAAAQGMSLNSWVSQAVQGALRGQGGWPGGTRGPWGGGSPGGSHDDSPGGSSGTSRGEDGRPGDPGRPGGSSPHGPGAARTDGAPGNSGSGPGPGNDPGRRRPDEGDGGVHGWVRG